METELFRGSKLKIERAKKHILELNDVLTTFSQTDFYRLAVEEDMETGRYIRKFKMTEEIPDDVPLIIGDAVHNLRTALDHGVCELITLAGGIPSRWVRFPFQETRQKLEASMKGGAIQGIGSDVIALILNDIQPHQGGNDPLYALHALDIADKHKLLVPVLAVAKLTHVSAIIGGTTFDGCTFVVGSGGELRIEGMPMSGKVEVQKHGHPTFYVLFDQVEVFGGRSVIPTLHQLARLVSEVIQKIEMTYLSRSEVSP